MVAILPWTFSLSLIAAGSFADSDKDKQFLSSAGIQAGVGTVCEIGAGDGSMSIRAAKIAGPASRVYASELGENRLRQLREKVATSGLSQQITVVESDPTKTNFPQSGCDSVILRDVYHHLTDPASFNKSILESLKPGGKVAVLDFTPPGKEGATPADRGKDGTHGVFPNTVSKEMEEAGFEVVKVHKQSGDRWFLVILSKPLAAKN